MQIASLVLAVVSLIISMTGIIYAIVIHQKKNKKEKVEEKDERQEDNMINDLINFCKENGIEDAFLDTSSDFLGISSEKYGNILNLIFPISKDNKNEYMETLEFQKEKILDFLKEVNKDDKN